jgi:hypothetical protein
MAKRVEIKSKPGGFTCNRDLMLSSRGNGTEYINVCHFVCSLAPHTSLCPNISPTDIVEWPNKYHITAVGIIEHLKECRLSRYVISPFSRHAKHAVCSVHQPDG